MEELGAREKPKSWLRIYDQECWTLTYYGTAFSEKVPKEQSLGWPTDDILKGPGPLLMAFLGHFNTFCLTWSSQWLVGVDGGDVLSNASDWGLDFGVLSGICGVLGFFRGSSSGISGGVEGHCTWVCDSKCAAPFSLDIGTLGRLVHATFLSPPWWPRGRTWPLLSL